MVSIMQLCQKDALNRLLAFMLDSTTSSIIYRTITLQPTYQRALPGSDSSHPVIIQPLIEIGLAF
jgi:hypothetical protein